MAVPAVQLRAGSGPAADEALAAVTRYLDRCKLAGNTVGAYQRQCRAYVTWLGRHHGAHPDAFSDLVGAEAAVTAWRRHLLATRRLGPASVNQALAAVTLLYEHGAQLRIHVKRARVQRRSEPAALEPTEQGAMERASVRRGPRDAAIIAVLLYAGARVEECARLQTDDVAITARTGEIRLLGKGDQVRTIPLPTIARQRLSDWLLQRGNQPGPLWAGQRGRLTISGITQVVLAVGSDAKLDGKPVRPQRLRHTYATRLRQSGADPAQVQALLGHARLETTAVYFQAGPAEQREAVEKAFEQ
jgi:site-specific recombinase XerD